MRNDPLPRIDRDPELRQRLLSLCRLRPGDVWEDPVAGHRIGCLDASNPDHACELFGSAKAVLAIHDPPYNVAAFGRRSPSEYVRWCENWIRSSLLHMETDASMYVWLGADQDDGFQPLPDFMLMMRSVPELRPRSFITVRNQRGYGTQKNWMAVRQELLYYVRGKPHFKPQYTEIPKVLRGYYKTVDGTRTENLQRSKSGYLRAGNVWIDVQQVFYRMEENVSGCYAQKPLKAIERIILASSQSGDALMDFFLHSGTSLLASERLGRRLYGMDIDPIFCELSIRRLENFRHTGRTGWQNGNPFGDTEPLSSNGSRTSGQLALGGASGLEWTD